MAHYVDLSAGVDGAAKTITGATKANPCQITSNGHGFSNGDTVYIYGVLGMLQLNGYWYTVANSAANTFTIGVDSSAYSTYTSGGSATKYGTATIPFLTVNAANTCLVANVSQEIRVAKTTAYTNVACAGAGVGWTNGSVTVTTSADLRASIAIGDYIGKTTAAGNGAEETFYRVNAIAAATITLEIKYAGTTASEASCNKLVVITTGAAGANAMTPGVTGGTVTLSGGWNLTGTPAQDGETWFKANEARTGLHYGITLGTNNAAISKINLVETGYGIVSGAGSSTVDNCTVHGYVLGFYPTASTQTATSCCASHAYTSGAAFSDYSGSTQTLVSCVGLGISTGTGCCFQTYGATGLTTSLTLTNCKGYSAANGLIFYSNSTTTSTIPTVTITNLNITNCGVGINNQCANVNVSNVTCTNCTDGFGNLPIASSGSTSAYIKSCTFSGCTNGLDLTYGKNHIIDTCTFTNCSYGILLPDQYCGDNTVMGCTFTTPTNYAIYRANGNAGVTRVYNSTIDAPSIAKAYNLLAASYFTRQYVFQNAFGLRGTVWGAGQALTDTGVFRTTAPSLSIAWNATSTTFTLPIKVASAYVQANVTKTYTMYLKAANASWAGTLTPVWKLDGATIKTESNITSLTTSWVQYQYSCANTLITADGELSLEFIPNMNTYTMYVDDLTVA